MPNWVPALVVEILSRGNTHGEIARKIGEYFAAGVALVWVVDPRSRTVAAYSGPDQSTTLSDGDELDGGSVLPGFTLALTPWFDWAMKVNRSF
jgi:Uma2 family endonuclease